MHNIVDILSYTHIYTVCYCVTSVADVRRLNLSFLLRSMPLVSIPISWAVIADLLRAVYDDVVFEIKLALVSAIFC